MANKGTWLTTGQYLSVGDYLVSDNGQFFVVMQSDGNFVLYQGSGPSNNQGYIWSISHTSLPTGQYFAIMQNDGNFVVYHGTGPSDNQGAIWATNTNGQPGGQFFAIMQNDGNFVLYQGSDPAHQGTPFWATNTFWVSHRVTTGYSLTADDWMGTNDYLLSDNQLFAAIMQSDGNFVLSYTTYSTSPTVRPRPDGNRPFWASNTNRSQGQYIAVLTEDGHFILHNGPASGEEKDLTSYWSAGSQIQNVPLQATMQDDGNFVLYHGSVSGQQQAYWASNTARADNRVTGRSFLLGGEELDAQDCLVSSNGLYFAVMQGNGNFVLYHTTDAVHASPDPGLPYKLVNPASGIELPQNQCFATMQTDGNFVVYYREGSDKIAYWATGTNHSSQGQYIAVLHDNGDFAVYSGNDPNQVSENTRLWQSNTAIDPNAVILRIVSGDGQSVKQQPAWVNFAPLVVKATHQNGTPAAGVSVIFERYQPFLYGLDVSFEVTHDAQITDFTTTTDSNGIAIFSTLSANWNVEESSYFCIDARSGPWGDPSTGSIVFTETFTYG